MIAPARCTTVRTAAVTGPALHRGTPARVQFAPAPPGWGITLQRTDRPAPPVAAAVEHATATARRTVLGTGDAAVATVEHLLAAVYAAGLDDLRITVDGPEPPAGDGSALPFLEALRAAGRAHRPGPPTPAPPARALTVRAGASRYVVRPAAACRVVVTIDFPHPLIGRQQGAWTVTPEVVARELAAARTFGFAEEAAALRADGLALGASPATALILSREGLVDGRVRWADEFVRHKALDLVGDLMLAGALPAAEIIADRPSHAGNLALVRALSR